MTGRMNLILIGTGVYQHWPGLKLVQPHHDRFAEHVREQWQDARITDDAAVRPWTAPELLGGLATWLTNCQDDDDLLLLWSGHGHTANGKHRLVTYESPAPGEGMITPANAVTTEDLADYLIQCPARRIVVLLNTCWSGDGGQQLAAVVGNAVADSLADVQERSMVIISSARREESVDGAFVSSILKVLGSEAPPAGLAPEHRWEASDRCLSPERLCAAVNVWLKEDDHQAQLQMPYGVVGDFFRRIRPRTAATELPSSVITRLLNDFPDQLSSETGGWDAARIRRAIEDHGVNEPSGELADRLHKLALGLSTLEFLEKWLGSGAGLANRLEPAWASVLLPIHRIPRPTERFGFIEQVVLHGDAKTTVEKTIVEFVARVIREAGDNPCDDRLYQWAQRQLTVDRQVVDDALKRLDSRLAQNRVIIYFGMIAADGEDDALPSSVIAWLYSQDGRLVTSPEYPFDPPYDVADMVARLVSWARAEAGDIVQVDVALPISLFRSTTRPETARLRFRRNFSRPIVESSGVVVRWADRISNPDLRSLGLNQGNKIATMPDPLCWIDRNACVQALALHDQLMARSQAVAFAFEPDDLEFFYAAAYNSPYVLWSDGKCQDILEVQREVKLRWQDLPSQLREAYRSCKPMVIHSVHAVWDDPDWLENIVPKLVDPNHRLSG
jgi:hypothetical protein